MICNMKIILRILAFSVYIISIHSANDGFLKDIQQIASRKPLEAPKTPPAVIAEKEVIFTLVTKQKKKTIVSEANTSEIDPSKKVKFIIHGWNEGAQLNDYYGRITDAWLKRGDYNIIQVDWFIPAHQPYGVSAQNTHGVGDRIGKFIAKLNKDKKIPLNNFHLIGHSLGGQVAGFAGQKVIELTGSKVRQITGLDAAGPLYEVPKVPKNLRLSNDDAVVVDAIHTDGGVFGFKEPIGTIDFFPNGGVPVQPGCTADALCSHHRSYEYYIRALNEDGIPSTECDSWAKFQTGGCTNNHKEKMGIEYPPGAKGNYYLNIVVHNKAIL